MHQLRFSADQPGVVFVKNFSDDAVECQINLLKTVLCVSGSLCVSTYKIKTFISSLLFGCILRHLYLFLLWVHIS